MILSCVSLVFVLVNYRDHYCTTTVPLYHYCRPSQHTNVSFFGHRCRTRDDQMNRHDDRAEDVDHDDEDYHDHDADCEPAHAGVVVKRRSLRSSISTNTSTGDGKGGAGSIPPADVMGPVGPSLPLSPSQSPSPSNGSGSSSSRHARRNKGDNKGERRKKRRSSSGYGNGNVVDFVGYDDDDDACGDTDVGSDDDVLEQAGQQPSPSPQPPSAKRSRWSRVSPSTGEAGRGGGEQLVPPPLQTEQSQPWTMTGHPLREQVFIEDPPTTPAARKGPETVGSTRGAGSPQRRRTRSHGDGVVVVGGIGVPDPEEEPCSESEQIGAKRSQQTYVAMRCDAYRVRGAR